MMAQKLSALQAPLCLILVVLAVKWALHANRGRLETWRGRWRVRRAMTALGLEHMDGIRVGPGAGMAVEHVVRMPGCLLTIATRDMSMVGDRPDSARGRVEAIRVATMYEVPVEGLVVLVGTVRACRMAAPAGAVMADDVADRLLAFKALHPPDARVAAAWARLGKAAGSANPAAMAAGRRPGGRVQG